MYYNDQNEKIIYIDNRNHEPLSCTLAGITYPNPDYKIPRYPAIEYQFEYVISGKGYIETSENTIEITSGMMYAIKKGANLIYYADPKTPFEKIWINMNGKTIEKLFEFFSLGDVFTARVNVLNIFLEIHNKLENIDKTLSSDTYVDIVSLLFRMLSIANKDSIFPSDNDSGSRCEKIRAFIDANVYSEISLDIISENLKISKMHIIRLFKQKYGITPIQYLMERKIEIAKSLLRGTVMPIKEIALLLNYSNTQHFSSSFRISVGCTPNSYRKGTNSD